MPELLNIIFIFENNLFGSSSFKKLGYLLIWIEEVWFYWLRKDFNLIIKTGSKFKVIGWN
jgi:hypothetical protein